MSLGNMLHHSLGRVLIDEAEVFEVFVVRGGVVKVGGDVTAQPSIK